MVNSKRPVRPLLEIDESPLVLLPLIILKSRQAKIWRQWKTMWLVFGLILTGVYRGCGSPRIMDPAITIALEAGSTRLDARMGLSAESERIQQWDSSSLVRRGKRFEILSDLATRWECLNPQTYWFYLRSGVRFHDGKPLTSRDMKYTFESLLNGSLISPKFSTFHLIQTMETPDEHTICRISLELDQLGDWDRVLWCG